MKHGGSAPCFPTTFTMKKLFTAADAWNGGFYELAIELGPRSDERLLVALKTLWRCDGLNGCHKDSAAEPSNQPRILPDLNGHLLGIATVPGGRQVACGTFTVREDNGSDWLGFYLPMGALETVYDVGAFPFNDDTSNRAWREPLDTWLVQIAKSVFSVTPFSLALLGHEVSGETSAEEIKSQNIPKDRWIGYLWQENEHLVWYPPAQY